ncbi:MAG: hypothetical protein WA137_05285 [Methanothrix sp.]
MRACCVENVRRGDAHAPPGNDGTNNTAGTTGNELVTVFYHYESAGN